MPNVDYVHGYDTRENVRLVDQATTLSQLLHFDTHYPAGSRVLEAGCGVGAQTVTLAANSPEADILSMDLSAESLRAAAKRVAQAGHTNVTFQQGDIYDLPFEPNSFDHIFVCFVLEHLPEPERALTLLRQLLKPDATITVIEGDHGSAYFHPDSVFAQKTIQCLVDLQAQAGGDSLIGRRLYPILVQAQYRNVRVSPRMVYADSSLPHMVEGFTKNTFTAMVEGVRERALKAGLIDEATWERGIGDLYRTAKDDGTFCYTFFKGTGSR